MLNTLQTVATIDPFGGLYIIAAIPALVGAAAGLALFFMLKDKYTGRNGS